MKNKLYKQGFHGFSILFFILFMITGFGSSAQIVKPLGEGIPNGVDAHCYYKGDLYIVHPTLLKNLDFHYHISRWNGVFWADLDSFIIYAPGSSTNHVRRINAMTFYNGELYLVGTFDSILNVPHARHIVKLNGHKFTGIGGQRFQPRDSVWRTTITSMVVFKNRLIIAGKIDTLVGLRINNMAAWDGSKWDYVGTKSNQGVEFKIGADTTIVNSMLVYQDSLFVFGRFSLCGGLAADNVAKWDGINWNVQYFANIPGGAGSGVFYKGDLYVTGIGNGNIYKTTGTSKKWTQTNTDVSFQNASLAVLNNKIWVCGIVYVQKAGGITWFAQYDGNQWAPLFGNLSLYEFPATFLDTFDHKMYILGWFSGNRNIYPADMNAGIVDTRISKISGYLYDDMNGNCIYDTADKPLANKIIQTNPRFYCAVTDSTGYYEFYIPSDNYKIRYCPGKYQKQTCPAMQNSISVNALADSTYNQINFASAFKPDVKDVKIVISGVSGGFRAIKGKVEYYRIDLQNIGTKVISSGKFYLTLPSKTSEFSAIPPPDSTAGDSLIWNFSNLSIKEERHVDFKVKSDTSLAIQDIIQFHAGFDTITNFNDSDLSNNFDTLTQTISKSHDPNNKQSFPSGNITTSTTNIRYMIHFQNTGTSPATKVVVVDTLDLALPLTEVILNSASHPYSLKIDNNVLIWTFDHINLPDSSADILKSQGYISFNTGIKQGVGTGTEIKNKAYIYFDYEEPVATNVTINKIAYQSTGIQPETIVNKSLRIYPNPAHDLLNFENKSNDMLNLTFYNSVGQSLKSILLPGLQTTTFDTEQYPSGMYFFTTNEGEANTIIISH